MRSVLDKIDETFATVESGQIYRSIIGLTEKILIEKALERSSGKQIMAAKVLGLNRNTLRMKIKKLNILLEKYRL